jgi:hypothetical protein
VRKRPVNNLDGTLTRTPASRNTDQRGPDPDPARTEALFSALRARRPPPRLSVAAHGQVELHGRVLLFGAVYLSAHGIVKIVLVIALLLNKLWAYPWMIVVLVLFIGYQSYGSRSALPLDSSRSPSLI